jgi:hypothetical protein
VYSWQTRTAGNNTPLATTHSWQQHTAGNNTQLATTHSCQRHRVQLANTHSRQQHTAGNNTPLEVTFGGFGKILQNIQATHAGNTTLWREQFVRGAEETKVEAFRA